MIRDSEFSDDAINKFIQSDSVGRNTYLDTFIGALNSIDKNTYISIDANWGAGKTVFMKQIEYLNYVDLDAIRTPSLDHIILETFQEKYVVFYYNAWENDHHDDPLQSLLFSLIDKFYSDEKRRKKVKALAANAVKSIAKGAVKSFTNDIVDLDKIGEVETIDDLVKSITAVNERKKAITEIIGKILPADKKLLFIIDELDRCNPEFAVRLMEVTKHYYNDDNMVFVLSTNNRQLVHTIRKYYGEGFDGYGYLDKLYDLILDLPPVDIEQYFQKQLSMPDNGEWVNSITIEIAKHLNMTMREANRYATLFSFVKSRLVGASRWYHNETEPLLTYFVFIPFVLALKIRNIEQYDSFVRGDGEFLVKSLFESDDIFQRIIVRNKSDDGINVIDIAVEAYRKMITSKKLPYDQVNHNVREAGDLFREILPLIASVGNIDSPRSDDE